MKIALGIILAFTIITGYSQINNYPKLEIAGQVLSAKTSEPIPYAHIVLGNTGVGTVTNELGAFRFVLPYKHANGTLEVSSIGFESSYFKLSSIKKIADLTFRLKESTKFLEGVIITPKDEARQLVELAIKNINVNYPTTTTQLEGFLRAKMKKGDSIANVNEGVYLIEKEGYNKRSKNGKVKLIKGRALESKEISFSFYGAHHIPHNADFVHFRRSFINESKTKYYYYEILDTIKSDGRKVVRVGFQSKKKNSKGEIFINLEDHAFLKILYQYDGDEKEDNVFDKMRGTSRLYGKYNIEYQKVDSLWHLSFVEYKSAMSIENGKDTLSWTDVFSTTKIRDSVEPIAYEDQFQYSDITLRNMGEYDSTKQGNRATI